LIRESEHEVACRAVKGEQVECNLIEVRAARVLASGDVDRERQRGGMQQPCPTEIEMHYGTDGHA
jgi:hypothetical protein